MTDISESRGVTTPRRSGKGCPESGGYVYPGWYVPGTDETVTHRETPRVSHRPDRGRQPGRPERRDCRARDYRRGLSPYSTPYSDPRFPASFSNSPARARPTVRHAQTTRLVPEACTTPITDDASTEKRPTRSPASPITSGPITSGPITTTAWATRWWSGRE
jgi:hypothetical protein